MKFAIHGRKFDNAVFPHIQKLLDVLKVCEAEIFVSDLFADYLKHTSLYSSDYKVYLSDQNVPEVDFVISLGGDGTLLETVTHVGPAELPILGINTGRLGFLATVSQELIREAIEALYKGNSHIENRSLIQLKADKPLFNGLDFGLNEFAIMKKDTSSMIVVHTFLDGIYLNSYWADGLIVATPTGSTGYSLSCGGPVVVPQSNNLIITPVSPHNLTVRPLVVSDKSVISFKIEGRSENFLISLDSRSQTVDASVRMSVHKCPFYAKLVRLEEYSFMDTLRQKLNWGLDVRN
jgi:NAD+ kinase